MARRQRRLRRLYQHHREHEDVIRENNQNKKTTDVRDPPKSRRQQKTRNQNSTKMANTNLITTFYSCRKNVSTIFLNIFTLLAPNPPPPFFPPPPFSPPSLSLTSRKRRSQERNMVVYLLKKKVFAPFVNIQHCSYIAPTLLLSFAKSLFSTFPRDKLKEITNFVDDLVKFLLPN